MKQAETYRKAAQLLERQHHYALGACEAIQKIAGWDSWSVGGLSKQPRVAPFVSLFKPEYSEDDYTGSPYWFGLFTEDNMNCRILALCFMAAIVENP